jgi:hypothetical protein
MFESAHFAFCGDLEKLRECGSWDNPFVVRAAAAGGNLDCLLWALEHGAPFDARWSLAAAWYGHAHILQAMVDAGLPLHADTANYSLEADKIECLKISATNKVFPTADVVSRASNDCKKWIVQNSMRIEPRRNLWGQ